MFLSGWVNKLWCNDFMRNKWEVCLEYNDEIIKRRERGDIWEKWNNNINSRDIHMGS